VPRVNRSQRHWNECEVNGRVRQKVSFADQSVSRDVMQKLWPGLVRFFAQSHSTLRSFAIARHIIRDRVLIAGGLIFRVVYIYLMVQ
jgi:hypothetical protein